MTADTPSLTEAIAEAVDTASAELIVGHYANMWDADDVAKTAIEAAYPIIAKAVREQARQEIEAWLCDAGDAPSWVSKTTRIVQEGSD